MTMINVCAVLLEVSDDIEIEYSYPCAVTETHQPL